MFKRDEKNLADLGIGLPFDQYYEKWVRDKHCGNNTALIGEVADIPDRTALVNHNVEIKARTSERYRELTHDELLRYSRSLAECLIKEIHPAKAVNNDSSSLVGNIIPIYLGRTIDTVAAILGVMRTGAAFLLLDIVEFEDNGQVTACERFTQYFSDLSLPVQYVITTKALWQPLAASDAIPPTIKPIFLDDIINSLLKLNIKKLPSHSHPDQLCYMVFSSGTTGNPKGIKIRHAGLVSRLLSHYTVFEEHGYDMMNRPLKVPLLAPLRFDASIMQILLGLGCGGSVLVVDEYARNDNRLLLQYLKTTEINAAILIPDQFRDLNEHCEDPQYELPNLSIILSTGEAFDSSLIKRWRMGERILINGYGPSEMTIGLSLSVVTGIAQQRRYEDEVKGIKKSLALVSVGQPMLGTKLLIVDYDKDAFQENTELTVFGCVMPGKQPKVSPGHENKCGEIIAIDMTSSIACRAESYTNESQHIFERNFIYVNEVEGKYTVVEKNQGLPAYRTGDRATIILGELCVVGRYGSKQVKKNGRLIRLENVEAVLQSYLLDGKYKVFNSVIVAYRESDQQILACLNEVDLKKQLDISEEDIFLDIRKYATRRLYQYELPSRWKFTTLAQTSRDKGAKINFVNDLGFTVIYRQGKSSNEGFISRCIKEAWLDSLSNPLSKQTDLRAELINDETQFDEIGGDSLAYVHMLSNLRESLTSIFTTDYFTKKIYHELRLKRQFGDFVKTIECHSNLDYIKQSIFECAGSVTDSLGGMFLLRSPFGTEHYTNLNAPLQKKRAFCEVELPYLIDADTFSKQLSGLAIAIINKVVEYNWPHIILVGHSAGGMLSYRLAQEIVKINKGYKIIVIMLDTPASAFAQSTDLSAYKKYILNCLRKTLVTEDSKKIDTEFTRLLKDAGCYQINYSRMSEEHAAKLKIIFCAEEYMKAKISSQKSLEKIAMMMMFCRAELDLYLISRPLKNVKVKLLSSRQYCDKISCGYLLWDKAIVTEEPVVLVKKHKDFIAEEFNEPIAVKINKLIMKAAKDLKHDAKIEEAGSQFIKAQAHNVLGQIREKGIGCYIEPLRNDSLLKDVILYDIQLSNKPVSRLILGDAGMGKTAFMLKLAEQINSNKNYGHIALYVNLKNAYKSGFLQGAPLLHIITNNHKHTLAYLNRNNIIYLIDGGDEIAVSNLYKIFDECLERDEGLKSGYKRHVVFTCRKEVLVKDYDKIHKWFGGNDPQKVNYQRFELQPLTVFQINLYLADYVTKGFYTQSAQQRDAILRQYQHWIRELPGLSDLIQTPLLLQLVTQILPEIANRVKGQNSSKTITINRSVIYAHFFINWLEIEGQRLTSAPDNSQLEAVFQKEPRLSIYIAVYSINLAIQLWESENYEFKILAGTLDDKTTLDQDLLEPSSRTQAIFYSIIEGAFTDHEAQSKWKSLYTKVTEVCYLIEDKVFIGGSDRMLFRGEIEYNVGAGVWLPNPDQTKAKILSAVAIRIIRAHSLLKVCDNEIDYGYRFLHKSIIEYLTGLSLLSSLSYFQHFTEIAQLKASQDVIKQFLINEKPIREEPGLIKMIVSIVTIEDEKRRLLILKLWDVVMATRHTAGLSIAASNATTIIAALCPAYFSGKDLSDVEIPFADLSNSMCRNTIFRNADLSSVWCLNTDFSGAKFYRAKLSGKTKFHDEEKDTEMNFFRDLSIEYSGVKAITQVNGSWHFIHENGGVYKCIGDYSYLVEQTPHNQFYICQLTSSGYCLFVDKAKEGFMISCYQLVSIDSDKNGLASLSPMFNNRFIAIDSIEAVCVDNLCRYILVGGSVNNMAILRILLADDFSMKNEFILADEIRFVRIIFSPSSRYFAAVTNQSLILSADLLSNNLNADSIKVTEILQYDNSLWKETQILTSWDGRKGDLQNLNFSNSLFINDKSVLFGSLVHSENCYLFRMNLTIVRQPITALKFNRIELCCHSPDGSLYVALIVGENSEHLLCRLDANFDYIDADKIEGKNYLAIEFSPGDNSRCEVFGILSNRPHLNRLNIRTGHRLNASPYERLFDSTESVRSVEINGRMYMVVWNKNQVVIRILECRLFKDQLVDARELKLSIKNIQSCHLVSCLGLLLIESENILSIPITCLDACLVIFDEAKFNKKRICNPKQITLSRSQAGIYTVYFYVEYLHTLTINPQDLDAYLNEIILNANHGQFIENSNLIASLVVIIGMSYRNIVVDRIRAFMNVSAHSECLLRSSSGNLYMYNINSFPIGRKVRQMTDLKDGDMENAETGELYISELGEYIVRDSSNVIQRDFFSPYICTRIVDDPSAIDDDELRPLFLKEALAKGYILPANSILAHSSDDEMYLNSMLIFNGSAPIEVANYNREDKFLPPRLNHILEFEVLSFKDRLIQIFLTFRVSTLIPRIHYELYYKGQVLQLGKRRIESPYYNFDFDDDNDLHDVILITSLVSLRGDFLVVILSEIFAKTKYFNSRRGSGEFYFDDDFPSSHDVYICYKFNEQSGVPLRIVKSEYTCLMDDCLPSVGLDVIFTKTGSVISYLPLSGNKKSTECILCDLQDLVCCMKFVGLGEEKMAVITSCATYLFSLGVIENEIKLNIIWFCGEHKLNMFGAKFNHVFGLTQQQCKVLENFSIRADNTAPKFEHMHARFFKRSAELQITKAQSIFTNVVPNLSVTPLFWVVTTCVKRGVFLFSERPESIIIEAIQNSSHVVIEATMQNRLLQVNQVENINALRHKFANNFDIKQYQINKENAISLLSLLYSDEKIHQGHKSINNWLIYALQLIIIDDSVETPNP
jgi:non-ribosomal peptide synthetase component F